MTAAAGGTVIMAQWYGGYGNYMLIDHGGGYSTGYGHLSAIYVSNGQTVQRGQAIGAVGSTGASTGPHLHFEMRIDWQTRGPRSPAPLRLDRVVCCRRNPEPVEAGMKTG